ncbi:aspartate/glutamate racemase family protein [Gynuella sunshinyii]|uniref:Aspartate racemase n=1 Tax=Gynuella sunshinyii YC6258 TaxID=1445510 RepID=A0A0C5VX89_9GAMM|nr:aspartate/glutamate racemase family protein [Gynuella sunshinyii]AJQ97948.1 aspartate racemase [Gynuella sunshinyii YC6258]
MQTIGILGGMSWESTATYYRTINEAVRHRLGGLHSAAIILNSVDFAVIETLQQAGNWQQAGELLSSAAQSIEAAGADFLIIATNTMHKVAEQIEQNIQIPLLHIADATGAALRTENIQRVGLLGTAFTMEQAFYRQRLTDRYGIEVITPSPPDRQIVHDIIYQELCLGEISLASRQQYLRIIDDLTAQGAEGVILGCTEIGMLIRPSDTRARLFDTTHIHALQAVEKAIGNT